MTEVEQQQIVILAHTPKLPDLPDEANLRVFLEEGIYFLREVFGRNSIVVEVFKHLVEHFKQTSTVQPSSFGYLIDIIVLQGFDDGLGNVERILVLRIAIAQQAATHQGINVVCITEDADIADIKEVRQIVIIHIARSSFHANAEENDLTFSNAVAFS